MQRADVAPVLDIDARAFEDMALTREELLERMRKANTICMSAFAGDALVGYYIFNTTPLIITVQRFAVDYECRGQGIGGKMVDRWCGKLHLNGRQRIYIPVPEVFTDTLNFLAARGFRAERTMHNATKIYGEPVDSIIMCHIYKPTKEELESDRKRPEGLD